MIAECNGLKYRGRLSRLQVFHPAVGAAFPLQDGAAQPRLHMFASANPNPLRRV